MMIETMGGFAGHRRPLTIKKMKLMDTTRSLKECGILLARSETLCGQLRPRKASGTWITTWSVHFLRDGSSVPEFQNISLDLPSVSSDYSDQLSTINMSRQILGELSKFPVETVNFLTFALNFERLWISPLWTMISEPFSGIGI
jgi:hypothetical protein